MLLAFYTLSLFFVSSVESQILERLKLLVRMPFSIVSTKSSDQMLVHLLYLK